MARTETKIYLGHHSITLERLNLDIARAEVAAAGDGTVDSARRVGEASSVAKATEAFEAAQRAADTDGDYVVVRPLSADEWDDLVEAHPPRTSGPHADKDKVTGFNVTTGRKPLILAALVEPALDTLEDLDIWLGEHEVTRGELEGIAIKIWEQTNRAPFALA